MTQQSFSSLEQAHKKKRTKREIFLGEMSVQRSPISADVCSNLRWALGTFHGLRRAHLRRYLDEFVFRWRPRCLGRGWRL